MAYKLKTGYKLKKGYKLKEAEDYDKKMERMKKQPGKTRLALSKKKTA